MNTKSLSFRLVSFYALLITCGFVLLAISMRLGVKHFLENQLQEASKRRAGVIARELVPHIKARGEANVIVEVKSLLSPEATGRFVRITTARGRLVYLSGMPQDRGFVPATVPPLRELPSEPTTRRVVQADGRSLMVGAVTSKPGDGEDYLVEVGASLEPVAETLRQFLLALGAGFAGVILISVAGGWFLVRRALGPVERIAHTAQEISFQNPSQRLPLSNSGDEIERLSLALNSMLGRLEGSYLETQRFSADASHELRTPLAIIRGELEALAQKSEVGAEMRDALGSVLEEVDRMAKIVENLLALARLDAGEGKSEWVWLDLSQIAASTTEQMCVLAEDKGVAIRCETPGPIRLAGDGSRLKQVVVNLLDNAIKFTPAGGKITLTTGRVNGTATLEVTDTGIGIPEDALPRVFDRFYRVDKARSREQGGAGIGLSIVKSIVLAHGGKVEVAPHAPCGSRFLVQLPQQNEAPSTKPSQ